MMLINMEIARGIFSLTCGRGEFMGLFPPNVYLIVGEKTALIDSGINDPETINARLERIKGYLLNYIFITHSHRDHIGGARAIKEVTGAEILLHPLEGGGDRAIKEGDKFELGGITIEVLHTPGHSPGHICFWLPERGILFSGDHILGMGTTVINPWEGDMSQYINSLRKLLAYPIQLICPGHGPVIKSPHSKIKEIIRHRQEREGQILSCLKKGIRDIEGIVREIYPEIDPRLRIMAYEQVLSHLIKLEREGKIEAKGGKYSLKC